MTCPVCEQSSSGPRNRLDRNTRAGRILAAKRAQSGMNTQTRGLMILKKPGDRKMRSTKTTEVMIGVAVMLALMLTGKFAVEVKTEAAAMTSMGKTLTVTSTADHGPGTLTQAPLVVTTLVDEDVSPGTGTSLREAINAANG